MPNLNKLSSWFKTQARVLPWRKEPTPYRVWVSEVMLQQTQAAVVIPYFERWMDRFPTIESLAAASLEEVIKLWEGLGYYARARHMHQAAQEVVSLYRGKLPDAEEKLLKIKGLGLYTVGAILSFAFHQKAAAIDGNVARVLARLLLFEEIVDLPKAKEKLRRELLTLLPDSEPWIIMEGLIELGALICTKKPRCALCPLRGECLAFKYGRQEELPKRMKRPEITLLKRAVAVIQYQGEFLIRQEQQRRVMQGLYEFPYVEGERANVEDFSNLNLHFERELPKVKQSFTRYRASLYPTLWCAKNCQEIPGYIWVAREQIIQFPFSAGHRQILRHIS